MRRMLLIFTVGLALVGGITRASAEDINMTIIDAVDTTVVGKALAAGADINAVAIQGEPGSGTGMFPSFVQVKPAGNETSSAAYNTTVNDTNDVGPADEHNHEIQIQDLNVFVYLGTAYYGFILDINENSGGDPDNAGVSLDQVVVLTSTSPNQSSEPLPVGTVRYDMDLGGGDTIFLAFDEGSGKGDMTFLIPTSAFGGALATDYVYLYSAFGGAGNVNLPGSTPEYNYGQTDGFEEWSILPGAGDITVPDGGATSLLLGLSLLGLRALRRKK